MVGWLESFQIVLSVFLQKNMFSLLLKCFHYFFFFSFSGKYPFFHMVYFPLESYILWNFFSSNSYF